MFRKYATMSSVTIKAVKNNLSFLRFSNYKHVFVVEQYFSVIDLKRERLSMIIFLKCNISSLPGNWVKTESTSSVRRELLIFNRKELEELAKDKRKASILNGPVMPISLVPCSLGLGIKHSFKRSISYFFPASSFFSIFPILPL